LGKYYDKGLFSKGKRPYVDELGGNMEVLKNRRIIFKVAW
jgi:hypothetical protein